MKIYDRGGDLWNGRLSQDGRYLLCGGEDAHAPVVALIDLQQPDPAKREVLRVPGARAPRWIGPRRITWVVPLTDVTAERWECDLVTGEVHRTDDMRSLVAGNDFDATPSGHWASCLVLGGRLTLDGRQILGQGYRGVKVAGEWLLTVVNAAFFELRRYGNVKRMSPLPPGANAWTLSDAGHIGYGYWGEARVVAPGGEDRRATVTAWKIEGPSVWAQAPDGAWWAWRHAIRPGDGMPLVLGHPWDDDHDTVPGVTPCIVVEGIPAAYLHVVAADGRWLIAGGQGGHIAVHAVPLTAPRVPVRDVAAPPPQPPAPPAEEDEMHKPGVTIEQYDTELRSGQRWSMRAIDRNNPGVAVVTEFVPKGVGRWSVHQRFVNAAGEDRSGSDRIVKVTR